MLLRNERLEQQSVAAVRMEKDTQTWISQPGPLRRFRHVRAEGTVEESGPSWNSVATQTQWSDVQPLKPRSWEIPRPLFVEDSKPSGSG